MNIALVLAGGSGKRTNQSIPKQFITVNDIPIFIYTLKNIQKINCIDEIYIVGPDGWKHYVDAYTLQFKINKYKDMFIGGETRSLSILNGLRGIMPKHSRNDKIILTDANRPLISENIYKESVDILSICDCSVALTHCNDSMYISYNGETISEIADRKILYCAQTPESAKLGDMLEIYENNDNINNDYPVSALFFKAKKKVTAYPGSSKSFKITTLDDIEIFKALINSEKSLNLNYEN